MAAPEAAPLVNLTIDGKKVSVPKGTNLIDAAKVAGVDVPFYCYHPHLSVAGNCRMCQVQIKGQPKLAIGCNTTVAEGMEVLTQHSSKDVKDAQAATLEFILINHPLDCTVCDQAGHCKLQDYHYEHNARPSRFLEEKEHKVKAEPLGPHVILDGERCIMCTRCIRFCDEVTKTSELGMLNRGDRSVIAINPGRELANPLSGTVVDLCPVGALTHRDWRFNTRIWFTEQTETICPGCSTGCNVKVATRDGQVVQVKARLNSAVNKEWLCDEGRYGFDRFLPAKRLSAPLVRGQNSTWDVAATEMAALKGQDVLVFVAPDLLLEEYFMLKALLGKIAKSAQIAVAYRERKLSEVEAVLVSPDYAPNFKAAEFMGLVGGNLTSGYEEALFKLRSGSCQAVLCFGDRSILAQDLDDTALRGLSSARVSVATFTDATSKFAQAARVSLPGRSILEKSGLLINRKNRLQYSARCVPLLEGSEPEWRLMQRIAGACGAQLTAAQDDRALSVTFLGLEPRLAGLRIASVKGQGVCLNSYQPNAAAAAGQREAGAQA
ncbi:MAG: (2Fe-2S)-binding protein [Oligoflexia bacterium]|nr:(2Fe-2S)-binding protein [Oligoflexia bacterium]